MLFSLNVMSTNQYQSNIELFYSDILDYVGKYKIYLCIKTTHYFEEMRTFFKKLKTYPSRETNKR